MLHYIGDASKRPNVGTASPKMALSSLPVKKSL